MISFFSQRYFVFVCWCVENLIVPNAPHLFSFYKMRMLRVWYIFFFVTNYKYSKQSQFMLLRYCLVFATKLFLLTTHLYGNKIAVRFSHRKKLVTRKMYSLRSRICFPSFTYILNATTSSWIVLLKSSNE